MPKNKKRRTKKPKNLIVVEKFALKATAWIGSTESLLFHSALFLMFLVLIVLGVKANSVMLVLTTIVSLEAIYLAIFIQMSVNNQTSRLDEVSEDIEEIQEDIEEISEDIEGIEKEVDELAEDVEDLSDEIDEDEIADRARDEALMQKVEQTLNQLMQELHEIKTKPKKVSKKIEDEIN